MKTANIHSICNNLIKTTFNKYTLSQRSTNIIHYILPQKYNTSKMYFLHVYNIFPSSFYEKYNYGFRESPISHHFIVTFKNK